MYYWVAFVVTGLAAAMIAIIASAYLDLNFFWSFLLGTLIGGLAGALFDKFFPKRD